VKSAEEKAARKIKAEAKKGKLPKLDLVYICIYLAFQSKYNNYNITLTVMVMCLIIAI
jgi:hypothetical protein